MNLPRVEPELVPESIILRPVALTLNVTGTQQFIAIVLPRGVNQSIRWESSNPAVGTINATGFFTARTAGTTTITTRSIVNANVTGTANVTVRLPVEPPVEPPEPAPIIPGFGIITAILGILGAILILLKKKN